MKPRVMFKDFLDELLQMLLSRMLVVQWALGHSYMDSPMKSQALSGIWYVFLSGSCLGWLVWAVLFEDVLGSPGTRNLSTC